MKKFIKNNGGLILAITIFILLLIPIILISRYNHPSVDDYNYSIGTYHIVKNGGNIFDIIKGAIINVYDFRRVWHGAYTAVFIMSLQPAIFGEGYYFFSSIILLSVFIFSTFYFTKTLLVDVLKQDKNKWIVLSILLLILQIQFLPSAVQGFFWWNGAINYTFFYSLSLILFGMIIKYINGKDNYLHIFLFSLLSFLIGGGNYSTPLATMIVVVLMALYSYLKNKDKKWAFILISSLLIGIGLLISIKCPGTLVRQAQENSEGLGVINSIMTSLKLMMVNIKIWTRPYMILLFILSIYAFYPIVKKVNIKLKYPLIFTLLTFGIAASHFAAPLYALGYTGDGRLVNLPYFYYCIIIFLNIFYYMVYIKNVLIDKCNQEKVKFDKFLSIIESVFSKYRYYLYIGFIILFIISLKPYLSNSTSYNSYEQLKNGDAKAYSVELNDRIKLYLDKNIKDVEVPDLTVKPSMLFFSDITDNPEYWSNVSLKNYYDKNSIKKTVLK